MPTPKDYAAALRQGGGTGLQNYGYRYDPTDNPAVLPDLKGSGYMGALPRPDGNVSTELSIGVNGKEIPSIVPTLTQQELQHLMSGGQITPEIIQKAQLWSSRMKTPFAGGQYMYGTGLSGIGQK